MINNIINKIGTDKLLHFAFGAVISFVVTNVLIIQKGIIEISDIGIAIVGVVFTMILEFIKEFIIDVAPDRKDIIATLLGSIVPFIVNAISILISCINLS